MRWVAIVACLSACVPRTAVTRVTVFDPAEIAGSDGSGAPAPGVVDHDVVLAGRHADVLAVDGDQLRMRPLSPDPRCRSARCRWAPLELSLTTPLANVRAVSDVDAVAHHGVIPLGLVAGGLLAGLGGGMLALEETGDVRGDPTPAALAVTAGLVILAIEIHARLARDRVTAVRL